MGIRLAAALALAVALPCAAPGGTIPKEVAQDAVRLAVVLRETLPHREATVAALAELIQAHQVEKPDIWAARSVSLDGAAGLAPVVDCVVPGGEVQAWSGTSMAAPQVANLAAKILARHPGLSPAQVKRAIVEGADEKVVTGRKLRLMNPKRSLELAGELAASR